MNSKVKKVINIISDKVKHKEVIGVFKFKRSYLHDEELCFRIIKNIFVTDYYKEEHVPYKLYFKVERYKYDVLNVIDSIFNNNDIYITYMSYNSKLTIKDYNKKFKLLLDNNKLITYNKKK